MSLRDVQLDWIVVKQGKNEKAENYMVKFHVSNENDQGIAGCKIRLFNKLIWHCGYFDLHPTDEHGVTICYVSFKSSQYHVLFPLKILDTDIAHNLLIGFVPFWAIEQLNQPADVTLPPPPPEPQKGTLVLSDYLRKAEIERAQQEAAKRAKREAEEKAEAERKAKPLPEPPKQEVPPVVKEEIKEEKIDPMAKIEQGYARIMAFCDTLKKQGRKEEDIEIYREKMESLLLNGELVVLKGRLK